jgi:thymidine kinase
MFAGKSSAALAIVKRNAAIGRKTLCLTNKLDTRYSSDAQIVSHDRESHPAVALSELMPALHRDVYEQASCIIIEEAQFFPDLVSFVLMAVEHDAKEVIVVGLDGDSNRCPFGQVLDLIPYCDSVQKFKALCTHCNDGTEALFTYRKPGAPSNQINVGGSDQYEALCRVHYYATI